MKKTRNGSRSKAAKAVYVDLASEMATTIFVDSEGRPFARPARAEFGSDVDFLLAFHAYKDAIAREANGAFDKAFTSALRRR